MIIFTSICANYLPKAISLAKSVKQNILDAVFVLCLVEKEIHPTATCVSEFDAIVLSKDIGFENFQRFIFRHSIVEASTAVKAQFFKFLLEKYPSETEFIYLDPDIIVHSDFVELREALKRFPIVVCPHLLEPGNIDMEISSLQHGVYNLGFLALARSAQAEKFIDWWAERLFWYCYDDIPHGIFTDQRWIDLAPSFFDVYILKHRGYDFATWSLLNARVTSNSGRYYIHGEPLRFLHFSGYDSGTIEWAIQKWLPDKADNPFVSLYQQYKNTLVANGQAELGKLKWSYDYYESGGKISKIARRIVRKEHEIQFGIQDPYLYGNGYFLLRWFGVHLKTRIREIRNRIKSKLG